MFIYNERLRERFEGVGITVFCLLALMAWYDVGVFAG